MRFPLVLMALICIITPGMIVISLVGCDSLENRRIQNQREMDAKYHRAPDTTAPSYVDSSYDNVPYDDTKSYVMHRDLADCKVYTIHSENNALHVVRCPDSHTTTKTTHTTTKTTHKNPITVMSN